MPSRRYGPSNNDNDPFGYWPDEAEGWDGNAMNTAQIPAEIQDINPYDAFTPFGDPPDPNIPANQPAPPAPPAPSFEEIKWDEPTDWDDFFAWAHQGAPTGPGVPGPEWHNLYQQYEDPTRATHRSAPFPWGNEPTQANQALAFGGGGNVNPLLGIPQDELRAGMTPTDTGQEAWLTGGRDALQRAYDTFQGRDPRGWGREGSWDPIQQMWNFRGSDWDASRQAAIDAHTTQQNNEAARAACEARNGTWNGVSCDEETSTPEEGVTCWDGSKAPMESMCPAQPPETVLCWDGSRAATEADCPIRPPVEDPRIAACIASGGVWDGAQCLPAERGFPTVDGPDLTPDPNLLIEDVPDIDYPFSTPQMQAVGNIQMGDDPISQQVNEDLLRMAQFGGVTPTPLAAQTGGALAQIMGAGGGGGAAETPFGVGVQSEIQDLLANAGALEPDPQRAALEFEQLRSPIDAMRRAQMAQGQAALAGRNILGQGPEVDFLERLEQTLAPAYAGAGQQLALAQMERADQRYRDALAQGVNISQAQAQRREARLSGALQLATNMSQQQADNLLRTAQTWTDRQRMLSDFALQSLDRDMEWSKFLSEYGLEREKFMQMVKDGQIAQLLPILQAYHDMIKTAGAGLVPYDYFDE